MSLKRSFKAALAGLATTALVSVGLISPADANTRSTVVIVSSNIFSSLNPSTPQTNSSINADISYLQGNGFNYYDNKPSLKKNTTFGSYKVVQNNSKGLKVAYTVANGRVWSDGVPITAVDLLMSHVLSSSKYSKDAGLGDPAGDDVPAFNSGGYGGLYDTNIVGEPKLSNNNMTLTVTYKKFIPDWEILAPGPSPVHALVQMAEGKKALGTVAEGNAAKAKFLNYFNTKNTANLKKIADIWSNDYNIKTINRSTNPLLLVVNGAYMVDSAVADQSLTLTLNPRYNSGPKTNGIKTVVFRFLSDSTAAVQALQNGEIDIYQGQPTADSVKQLSAIKSVRVIGSAQSVYEHIDLRVGNYPGEPEYKGVFAGYSQRARDLRTAFLLAVPRQQIVDTLVKPINPNAVVVNSSFLLPGEPGYNQVVRNSGVSKFTRGTQEQRTAEALRLVRKYYPTAGNGNTPVKINLLWGTPSNARRAAEAQLIKAETAKAGFDVTAPGASNWPSLLESSNYDAAFFAWVRTSVSQSGTNANFKSDGSNNLIGYNSTAMDSTLAKLEGFLTPKQLADTIQVAERLIVKDAITLPIFQHPAVTAVNANLKNVKPAPLSPTLVWNFWEWKY